MHLRTHLLSIWATICPCLGPLGFHVDLSDSKIPLLEICSAPSFEKVFAEQVLSSFSYLSLVGGACVCQSKLFI